jgi:uncharacterized protein YyaL (SSP411 family)
MQRQPKFTNRLINETSPYLLQHAHNPVDWFPWGEEAFEKARSEDKALLVSIGYSACHWCHVMEHESFEDEETAKLMNENFVNIKVDMEERPDVDQIYMNFVQLTTGRGGWPMNVFVTPEKLPFFGGTYFPPDRRYNMPSWQRVLASVADAYRDKRDELLHSANDILGELRRIGVTEFKPGGLTTEQMTSSFESMARSFDSTNGGFGGAPKFPPSMALEFLLRYYLRTGEGRALEIVERTCQKMANGGIFDQLGGGFHRYSVDAVWLVPHFEKMLYDNAQLIRVYVHLFQITGNEFYKRVASEILEYVRREMLDNGGGFYSSQDADSEGVEGKFFVWTPEEVTDVIGEADGRIFNFFYDISEDGNFEEKNIPNARYSTVEAADALGIDEPGLLETLERSRRKLFAQREGRARPFRDEKVIAAWNGLMLAAFADAAASLGNSECLSDAKKNADFILSEMRKNGRLLRTWKNGSAKLNAYLEDHADVADGLMELYRASGEVRYLSAAREIADTMINEFWDEENGGFYFTSHDHETLIVRNKDYYDNATPSGNSAAADVLLRLSKYYGEERYERYATTVLRLIAGQMGRFPQGFGRALSAMEFYFGKSKEIVIAGEQGNDLAQAARSRYLPTAVLAITSNAELDAEQLPLLQGRSPVDGKPTAYVCENFVCSRPVASVADLVGLLEE